MRTLPLGVLIVCGGTLAALPFRRYQSIPDASTLPTQVTGPSESALHAFPDDRLDSSPEPFPSLAGIDRFGASGALYEPMSQANRSVMTRRRHVDIPLTYEDLEVPIDQPKPVLDRFTATTSVRQQQLDQERIAGLVMPPMESLPLDQQQELLRVAESIGQTTKANATTEANAGQARGRLASSATPGIDSRGTPANSVLDPLPASQREAEPQRFWIRQPQ